MKKVLFVATVVKLHIMTFHKPFLKMFKENGWETSVAARNDYNNAKECLIPDCDHYFDVPFNRNPMSTENVQAFFQLKKIIDEGEFDIIHCHTPVGGIIGRLAAYTTRKHGTRVLYTAHGFHFFKGASPENWLLYYPAEWLCSWLTDTLITINQEDYNRSQKHLHAREDIYVPGVGINTQRFVADTSEKEQIRSSLGIDEKTILLLSVGELTKRKNQIMAINAVELLKKSFSQHKIKYLIVGQGENKESYQSVIEEKNLTENIELLGFRSDVDKLCRACDVFLFPSLQEGLPVALMEAMACGCPCVASKIRGNEDLIDEGKGGYLVEKHDSVAMAQCVLEIIKHDTLMAQMGQYNSRKIQAYNLDTISKKMADIYGLNQTRIQK